MADQLVLTLPRQVMGPKELLKFLRRHIEELCPVMDLDTRYLDVRAEILEKNLVEIQQLSVDHFEIEYEYDWDVYSGCSDQRSKGTVSGVMGCIVKDGKAYFDRFIPPPERTTVDEF